MPGIQVVGEAGNGAEAVELARRLRPDAVVMDLDMPGVDGFAATERIMAECPTPIVVVTSRVQPDQMGAAFRAVKGGAVGVFPKPEVPSRWDELARVLPGHPAARWAPGAVGPDSTRLGRPRRRRRIMTAGHPRHRRLHRRARGDLRAAA